MKKLLLIFAMAVVVLAIGCKDKEEICTTSVYTIVNQIESDIVVELMFGDKQQTTIGSGNTRQIYHAKRCHPTNVMPEMPVEVLNAEMSINGETVPSNIWRHEHWNTDSDKKNHTTYSLTVTDELLQRVRTESDLYSQTLFNLIFAL